MDTAPLDARTLNPSLRQASAVISRDDMVVEGLRAQLVAILDMSEMGVLLTDVTGVVLHLNLPLCQMLCFDEVKTPGQDVASLDRHVSTLLDPQDKSASLLLTMANTLRADQESLSPRQVLHLVVPRRATVQITGRKTPKGDLVFYFRDITVEADVDRMKSEFLSTAAH
jgi:hypothetical protein